MSISDHNRPGVDTDIVQTQVVRGCDFLFPGTFASPPLLVRGGDVNDPTSLPGELIIVPGQNVTTGQNAHVTFLRRSTNVQDEILILRASDQFETGPAFNIHGGSGDPNGSILAPESSLYFDSTTPGLWIKTTNDAVDTGWEQLATIPVTAEDLEQTLILGNTTGALPIIVNDVTSGIQGEDGVAGDGIGFVIRGGDSGGGTAGTMTLRAGNVTSGTGDGGFLGLAAGDSFGGATGGQGGDVTVTAGASGSSFVGGAIRLTAGLGGPGVGGFGGNIDLIAGNGQGGGGGTINMQAGTGATFQVGGGINFAGGAGFPGGDISFLAGEGLGPFGGAGGRLVMSAGGGDPATGGNGGDTLISAGNAVVGLGPTNGGNITLTPGTGAGGGIDGVVTVNGKLTVTGLIDPTGIIFTENTGDATDFPIGTNEGGVYVSDGSNGRTDNALYFKDDSGNHYQIAPPPPGAGLGPVEAWLRSSWGYIGPNSDSTDIDSVGLLNGINVVTNGNGSVGRTEDDGGVVIQIQSGTTPNTTYAYVDSQQLSVDLDDRFLMYVRLSTNTTSSNIRGFAGLRGQLDSSIDFCITDSASLNSEQYMGFSTSETPGSMSLVVANNGTKQEAIIAGIGTIDFQTRWMFIDASVTGQITLGTLLESGGELVSEATMVVTNSLVIPPSAGSLEVLLSSGLRGGAGGMQMRIGHVSMVTRADLVNQALGAAAIPLSTVLSVGNTMGANPIIVDSSTPSPAITGADNAAGSGVGVQIGGGNSTGGAGSGGTIILQTGEHDPAAVAARTGSILMVTEDATGTNDTGDVLVVTGDADAGDSGDMLIVTGDSTSANAGDIIVQTGDGDFAGNLLIATGNTSGAATDAPQLLIQGGTAVDGKGGQVEIFGGAATAGNNPGGSIILTPGAGSGTGSDGVVFIAGKLTVTGLIDPTGLELTSVGSAPSTPGGNDGLIWVNGSGELIFTNSGGDTNISTGGGGGTPLTIQDEGGNVETNTTTINFIGAEVTATSGGAGIVNVTVTATGGGGGTAWQCDTALTTNNTPQNLTVIDTLSADGEQTRVHVFITAVDQAIASKVYYRELEFVYLRTGGSVSELDRRTEGPHIRGGAFTTIEADLQIQGNDIVLVGTGESGTNIDWEIRYLTSTSIETACAGGGGGGGGEDLGATLALGNSTDGTNIEMTIGDSIVGADNAAGQGGSLTLTAGSSTGASGGGGSITLTTGLATGNNPGGNIALTLTDGSGTGGGGAFSVLTGTGGSTSGDGGDFAVQLGDGGLPDGVGGEFALQAGDGNGSGNGGGFLVQLGDANGSGTGGGVILTTGAGDTGGSWQVSLGNSTGTGVDGPDVSFIAGSATAGVAAGGNIVLTAGSGFGGGNAGEIQLNGDVRGTGQVALGASTEPATPAGSDGTFWVEDGDLRYKNVNNDIAVLNRMAAAFTRMASFGTISPSNTSTTPGLTGVLTTAATDGTVTNGINSLGLRFQIATTGINTNGGINSNLVTRIDIDPVASFMCGNGSEGGQRFFIGLTSAATNTAQLSGADPLEHYVGIEIDTSLAETEYQFVTDAATGSPTKVSTGISSWGNNTITIDASQSGQIRISIYNFLDGSLFASHTFTSNLPGSTTELRLMAANRDLAGATKSIFFHGMSIVNNARVN